MLFTASTIWSQITRIGAKLRDPAAESASTVVIYAVLWKLDLFARRESKVLRSAEIRLASCTGVHHPPGWPMHASCADHNAIS